MSLRSAKIVFLVSWLLSSLNPTILQAYSCGDYLLHGPDNIEPAHPQGQQVLPNNALVSKLDDGSHVL